jgi:hypothetical protein
MSAKYEVDCQVLPGDPEFYDWWESGHDRSEWNKESPYCLGDKMRVETFVAEFDSARRAEKVAREIAPGPWRVMFCTPPPEGSIYWKRDCVREGDTRDRGVRDDL